jgi:hypothetical protein
MVIHHDVVDGNEEVLFFNNRIYLFLVIEVVPKVVDQVLVVIIRIVVHILDRRVHRHQKNDEHDQDLVVIDKELIKV